MKRLKEMLCQENNYIVIKNMFWAFVIKGGALVISLLTTPAFISYFNDNVILGVWYTLLSVLIWFLNFDLGIGNGVRNKLVLALAEDDRKEAKYIISSGFFAIFSMTIILGVIGIILLGCADLNRFFNISESLISSNTLFISTCFVFSAILMRFMLNYVSSILYALQKSAVNNFLSLCVSVLQLIFVVVVHFDDPEQALKVLSIAYMLISNLPVLIAGVILFFRDLKDCKPNFHYIDKNHINAVMKVGGIFFICQILYMIIINTNEFIITRLFGPDCTTLYTFYYKVFSLVATVITLAMTPIWSMVTKAMATDDWIWINSLYKKIKISFIFVLVLEGGILFILQWFMNFWLGKGMLIVDYKIAIAFACFSLTFVYSGMLSTLVCGLGRMKLQAICYFFGAIFKFAFIIIVSKFTNNWSIVVWSNAFLLLPYCILQQVDLNNFLKRRMTIQACNMVF